MTKLSVGQEVPNFKLKDVDGKDYELYPNISQDMATIVTFFRGAW